MSRIRANAWALILSFGVTFLLSLVQLKLLTSHLEQQAVGVWAVLAALGTALSSFAELGLPAVLVRYGAKYESEGRLFRAARLYWLSLCCVGAAFLSVLAIVAVAGPWVASILGTEIDRRLLVFAFTAVGIGSLRAVNNATLRGQRRMPQLAALEIAFASLVTLGYFVLRERLSVPLVFTVFGGSSAIVALAGMWILHRVFATARAEPQDQPPLLQEVRRFWQGSATSGVFFVSLRHLDRPLLAGFVAAAQVAIFQVATRMALFVHQVAQIPLDVIVPEVVHKWEGRRRPELRADLELFTKLVLGLALGFALVLGIFTKPLILLVATPEYMDAAPVFWILLGAFLLSVTHQPLVMFIRAAGHAWIALFGEAIWLLAYLGLGAILLHMDLGLAGFAGGQIVASVLVLIYGLIATSRLDLPRPAVAFYARRILVSAAVWGAAVFLGTSLPPLPVWLLILLCAVAVVVGNVVVVHAADLTKSEEERTVALVAGRGNAARIVRFVLEWPRGFSGRSMRTDYSR